MILNSWHLYLPDEANVVPISYQALKIYTPMDLNSSLANYLYVGSELDNQYLELTAAKREENYKQR